MLSLASGEIRRLTDFDEGQTWGASWFLMDSGSAIHTKTG